MKKVVTVALVLAALIGTAEAEDICAPQISDVDVSDLALTEKYAQSCLCLKQQIFKHAETRFSPEKYKSFESALENLNSSYRQVSQMLNNPDGEQGTLDNLQTTVMQYRFLTSVLNSFMDSAKEE